MLPKTLCHLTLVLGGARSGKSRYAEALMAQAPPPWTYLATAQAFDDEMQHRIAAHQVRRDTRWRTLEIALDVTEAISDVTLGPTLFDCATLWLSNVILAERNVAAEMDRLVAAMENAPGPLVVVSNEVGLGIVPDTPLGRTFRDAQGILNQRIATIADRVILMAAGLPLTLKKCEERS